MTDEQTKVLLTDQFGAAAVHPWIDNPPEDLTEEQRSDLKSQIEALFNDPHAEYDVPGRVPNLLFRGKLSYGVVNEWDHREARPIKVKDARRLYKHFISNVIS